MTTTSMSDPLVGRVLDGRYEILARLARGGMATVYRAQDRRLTRTVAVKVMHDGLGDDAEFARKFDREARSAATLSNPHVVSVFDQGSDNGRPYIVMEFVQGCTLRHIITREAPLPPSRALDLLESVVSALSSAHEAGLVHRDVKPENVLISDRGQIKVADFGLARAVTSQTATATAGLLIGTVSYLPPELVTHGRADARSDVYSAGVVLFELLTGKKPHQGETPIQVAYSHVHNDIPAPSTLLVGNDPRSMDSRRIIPPYLDALVVACTRRQPADRPADGREMLHLLRVARRALSHGILDDPALTDQMSATMRRDPAETGSTAPDASSLLAADLAHAGRPTSPESVTGPIPPLRPSEPFRAAINHSGTNHSGTNHSGTGDSRASGGEPVRPTRQGLAAVPARTPVSPVDWHVGSDRLPVARPAKPLAGSTSQGPRPAPQHFSNDHDRRQKARRRRGVLGLLLTLVLATALCSGAYWWFSEGQWSSTPALAATQQSEANAVAAANGLAVSFVQQYSESIPKGTVIRTEPASGERIKTHGTVVAYVSKGPERYAVPKLIGLTLEGATRTLTDTNLAVGDVTKVYDEQIPADQVITTSQRRGDLLKRGVEVDLTVSKGRRPIEVTDWTGKKATDASYSLRNLGLTVTPSEQNSDAVSAGRVISQSPAKGNLYKGDPVRLVVSKGPVMVQVPTVAGSSEQSASEKLTAAGFKVKVVHATADLLRLDVVRAASPSQGNMAKQGSTVTIWVI